jgi:ABC-2 type transport system ATP-binding protein
VIDLGRVIAEGTADELKDKIGGEVLELHVADKADTAAAAEALAPLGGGEKVEGTTGLIRIQAGPDGTALVVDAVRSLDAAGIRIGDIALHKPTLDDVFLTLTGHAAEEQTDDAEPQPAGRRGGKRR